MKVIKEKTINSKLAQLILLDNDITLNVIYDNKCIYTYGGNTWKNIKDEEWSHEFLIDVAVDSVIEQTDEEFNSLVKMLI